MSTWTLLAELSKLGVKLEAGGDRLRYAGPQEVISPGLTERLKAQNRFARASAAKG